MRALHVCPIRFVVEWSAMRSVALRAVDSYRRV